MRLNQIINFSFNNNFILLATNAFNKSDEKNCYRDGRWEQSRNAPSDKIVSGREILAAALAAPAI